MVFVLRSTKSDESIHIRLVRTARAILNELRWREPSRLAEAVLTYRDRVRPGGYRLIRGSEILKLERTYFTTSTARLPYYKIERIECAGETVYVRSRERGNRNLIRGRILRRSP